MILKDFCVSLYKFKDMIGIYCIKNKINGKVYIGSSNNIERRFKRHKTELNTNSHSNKYLKKAYKKYGKDNFEFIILELCTQEELISKEIFYINKYEALDNTKGYNLSIPIKHPTITSNSNYRSILSEAKKGKMPSNYQEMRKIRWVKIKVYENDIFKGIYNSFNEAEREFNISKGYIFSYFKNPSQNRRKYKEFKFEKI